VGNTRLEQRGNVLVRGSAQAAIGLAQNRQRRSEGMTRLEQFIEDFTDESQRHCHVCEKVVPLESLLDKNSGTKVQSFTGRVFCGDECWESYKHAEGL
jgi:hypothetical protein